MSPGPSRVKKRLVYLDAGRLAGDVPVILRPSVPNRGALPAQIARRRWGLPGASAADLRSPGLPLLLRWGAATRAILRAAERWSQAVNTILTLRAPGFVGCKCQAACWPDRGNAGGPSVSRHSLALSVSRQAAQEQIGRASCRERV